MKIHSRRKRLLGLKTGHKNRFFFHKIHAKFGPRTFKTKEQAEAYAKEKGIKEFNIVPAKKIKFKIEKK